MTGEGPHQPPAQRRLTALRQLGVVEPQEEPELVNALCLVDELTGAHTVTMTGLDAERAWTRATTGVRRDVARDGSFAQLAVNDPEGFAQLTVAPGHPLAEHPGLSGLQLPVTCAAVAVQGPGGEFVGALEIIWPEVRAIGPEVTAMLGRVAAHAGHLIALRAEADDYRRFIELSPDPVTVLDVDGEIVMANPSLAKMLGHPGDHELVGTPFLDLVERTDRTRVTSDLARVLFARSRTAQIEVRLRRPDGEVVDCSVSAGNLGGVRRHVQLVIHDLSERLRGEDERTQLSEQLARAQRLDAVGQIAGGLAHDLNNLLVVMVSNLALAEESLDHTEAEVGSDPVRAVRRDLGELRLAVDRAGRLTSKLLEFARRSDGEHEVASVAEAAETVQGLIARSLGSEVSLVLDIDEGLPDVTADPIKLERALVNLVINAGDAMDDGGTVRIVGRLSRPVGLGADAPGGNGVSSSAIVVEVIDDGRGMDKSVLARAFEPLFTTKGEGGSGLGLATVAAFVDEIDASVQVDSVPGRGTRVRLTLPIADRPAGALEMGPDVPIGGARVLLVDPGERTRRVIARMLGGAGYRVRAVGSAEEALEAIEEVPAELLVSELSLPGMNGVRLLAEIGRRHPRLRSIALASVDAPQMLDGTPVLVKPFSHTRLLRTVEQVMRDRREPVGDRTWSG